MKLSVVNSIDGDRLDVSFPTKFYGQQVSDRSVMEYISCLVNKYWNRDIRIDLIYKRDYEEADIFDYERH